MASISATGYVYHLTQPGHYDIHPHRFFLQVEVQTVPGQGRGLFAVEKIRKGQQLLQIPDSLLLTADKAASECCIGSALKEAELPDWTVLATYLVELWDQHQQGQLSSYWAQYIALLPETTGCILEWTEKEVCAFTSQTQKMTSPIM